MTAAADGRAVVKVRLGANEKPSPGNTWTSPSMAHDDALTYRARLCDEIADIGDTAGFIEFKGRDGRPVSIRARLISVVELGQDPALASSGHRPATSTRGVVGPVDIHMSGGYGEDSAAGTAFLRQQAAHAHQVVQR